MPTTIKAQLEGTHNTHKEHFWSTLTQVIRETTSQGPKHIYHIRSLCKLGDIANLSNA